MLIAVAMIGSVRLRIGLRIAFGYSQPANPVATSLNVVHIVLRRPKLKGNKRTKYQETKLVPQPDQDERPNPPLSLRIHHDKLSSVI
mmetsp:Transcript_36681/g.57299  ORF Transcript_36681/g.57299 Transcript_36681/m.57299 type:complete len:87 (+) Transcript_36681:1500-1760(+)